MNLFGWLKTGPEAASKVLDAGIKGIDSLVYTDEEKAEANKKLLDTWLELQKTLGEETTSRSVTRRILSVLIIVPFVILTLAAAGAYHFDRAYAEFLLEIVDSQYGVLVLTVTSFYFGPYMIAKLLDSFRGKKSKKEENGNGA